MKKMIFKFPLSHRMDHGDHVVVDMPEEAKIIALQDQRGTPTIWAEVNPDLAPTRREFFVAGTGHLIEDDRPMTYVGTWQDLRNGFVWHIYEVDVKYSKN